MTEKSEISGAFCSTDIYKHTSCDENLQFEILIPTKPFLTSLILEKIRFWYHCTIEWTVILVFSENFQENKILNLKTANILNFIPYAQFYNLKSEMIKKVSFLSFLRLLSLVFGPRESNGGFEASRPKFQNFPNFEGESIRGGNEPLGKVGQRDRDPLNTILIKYLIWLNIW